MELQETAFVRRSEYETISFPADDFFVTGQLELDMNSHCLVSPPSEQFHMSCRAHAGRKVNAIAIA
jgi:hypothetical protein